MAKKQKDILELDIKAWLGNGDLCRCSREERAYFIDLLCIGWTLNPRGEFQTDGKPWSLEEIAACVRGDNSDNLRLLKSLIDRTVLKTDRKTGVVYDSRMRRDWEKKQRKSMAAKKSGTLVLKADEKPPQQEKVKADPPKKKENLFYIPASTAGTELEATLRQFIDHRRKIRKPMTDHAVDLLVKKLSRYPLDQQIELLETAIANGWQGPVWPKGSATREWSNGLFSGIESLRGKNQ